MCGLYKSALNCSLKKGGQKAKNKTKTNRKKPS